MKSNPYRWLILFSFLFICNRIVAQISPYQVQVNYSDLNGKQLITSPAAEAFVKYGQIPVSQFTGSADVKIPLYDIKVDNLDIPIYLSYNSQGVQPNNHAGWVGTGWSLFAGSAITRKVNGVPDEYVAPYSAVGYTAGAHLGWYYTSTEHTNITNTNSWLTNFPSAYSTVTTIDNKALVYDGAPDEFDFNIDGLSGAFFMGEDGNWKIRSNNKSYVSIKETMGTYYIQPYASSTATTPYITTFVEFVITAADGTQYYFGDDPASTSKNAIEFNRGGVSYSGHNVNIVPTAWHITKIKVPSGKVVNFVYFRDGVTYTYTPGYTSGVYSMTYTSNGTTNYGFNNVTLNDPSDASVNVVDPIYLKSITFPEGELLLNSSRSGEPDILESVMGNYSFFNTQEPNTTPGEAVAGSIYGAYPEIAPPVSDPLYGQHYMNRPESIWYLLNDIELDDFNGKKLRDITFSYNQDAINKRYFLNTVQSTGYYNNSAGINEPPYTFYYNTTSLPKYCSYNVDHWGFYNGPKSIPSLGYDANSISNYNLFRAPDVNFAQAGILTQISYPSGGSTTFQYELNRYKSWVGNLPIALTQLSSEADGAGLRVKKITNTDDLTGQNITYEYSYVNDLTNNVSSGILGTPLPTYVVNQSNWVLYNTPGYTSVTSDNLNFNYFSSNTIYPARNEDGTNVTYTNVIERQSNNGVYNGMKVTVFTNQDNGYMNNSPDAFVSFVPTDNLLCNYSDRSFERGNVLSESYFDNNNKLIKTITNTYNDDPNRFNSFVKSLLPNVRILPFTFQTTQFHFFRLSAIRNYTYYPYLKQQVVTDYGSGTSPLSTIATTNFVYDAVNPTRNLIKKTSITSKGEKVTTYFTYPLDYTVTASSGDKFSLGIQNLQTTNAIGMTVEQTIQRSNIDDTNLRTVNSLLNSYNNNVDFPDLIYKSEMTTPILNFNKATISNNTLVKDGSYQPKIYIDNFDIYGNPLQEHEEGGPNQAYQWGYNYSYPTAITRNATNSLHIADVTVTGVRDVFYDSFEEGNGTVSTLGDSKTGHYSHTGSYNTLLSNLDNENYILSYWQKINGTWTLQTNNIIVTNSSYQITLGGQIDDVRFYPANAQMTTYTYDPLVGMTSFTDAKGETTYYEYDSFQRLMNIKDQYGNVVKHYTYHYQGQ